jgi:rare lipoprotein A
MRKLMMGFLTTIAVLFAATAANASSRWSCEGAEYVCGSSSSKAAQSYDDSEQKAARATKRTRAAASNDDEAPVRRQKVKVAKADDSNDEAPAPRRRARNSDNDSGGGETLSGKASYYWEPQALASGGRFNPNAMTAAHKTLPFGTRVRVTNQSNGQSVEGVAPVTVRVLGRG